VRLPPIPIKDSTVERQIERSLRPTRKGEQRGVWLDNQPLSVLEMSLYVSINLSTSPGYRKTVHLSSLFSGHTFVHCRKSKDSFTG
jgi:hypothetical protein